MVTGVNRGEVLQLRPDTLDLQYYISQNERMICRSARMLQVENYSPGVSFIDQS
jgi:hypothetical protein